MMCRYAKLREQKDSFIRAAINASCPNMKKIWIRNAEIIQLKIDNLTDAEAKEIVSND